MSIPSTSLKSIATMFAFVALSVSPSIAATVVAPVTNVPAGPSPAVKLITSDVAKLNTRLTANYGKLGGEYQALQSQTAAVQSSANADAKAQNGHLTAVQVSSFTKQLSEVGQLITNAQQLGAPSGTWMANHPTAAKVMNSAESINAELSKDYGSLGGHYANLELQDDQVRAVVKSLAVEDNGLSAAQVAKFNAELTNLQTAINQDLQ